MEDSKSAGSKATIEVIDSGPLKINGNIILQDLKRDKETPMDEVLLCRCGKSSDKPFCDGSHKNK
ncbi:MAG: CDGSH iron-sulfur domain-containing protein [Bacteroidales bacterium]